MGFAQPALQLSPLGQMIANCLATHRHTCRASAMKEAEPASVAMAPPMFAVQASAPHAC